MSTAIIDYGSGNLHSVLKACQRAASDRGGGPLKLVSRADEVAGAGRIILPGVGAFGHCMAALAGLPGMIDALGEAVLGRGIPFLGICVGMQLLAGRGLEGGDHAGLGWIDGRVVPLSPADKALKVPHMGWNSLFPTAGGRSHPVTAAVDPGEDLYFIHGYRFVAAADDTVLATADYGGPVVAAVGRDNILGVQFHPEKSQAAGLRLLRAFLAWKP